MVFPLYDDNPFERPKPPYFTWGLIGINVFVFLIEVFVGEPSARRMIAAYGVTPGELTHTLPKTGRLPAELTLITHMFLHADWSHLIGNMVYLWVFGDDIEDALGPRRFLLLYGLAGSGGAILQSLPDHRSTVHLIGASGAISGILAAYLLVRPCARVSALVIRQIVRVPAFVVIGIWMIWQLVQLAIQTNDGVGYLAHIGGLFAGGAAFLLLRPSNLELFQCFEQPQTPSATS